MQLRHALTVSVLLFCLAVFSVQLYHLQIDSSEDQRPSAVLRRQQHPRQTAQERQHQQSSSSSTGSSRHATSTSQVYQLRSLAHPACLAEKLIRERRAGGAGNAEYWKGYVKPEWNCFKHGGHFSPGFPRGAATPRFILKSVVYADGEFFIVSDKLTGDDVSASLTLASSGKMKLQFGAYFSMVSGDWPQAVTDSLELRVISLRQLAALKAEDGREHIRAALGYFQPPTDFLSTYHVVVETVFPTFHALYDFQQRQRVNQDDASLANGKREKLLLPPLAVQAVTSRPVFSRYGFKNMSCRDGPRCLGTVWGSMYLNLLGGDDLQRRQDMLYRQVYGLGPDDVQLRYVTASASRGQQQRLPSGRSSLLMFDQLIVGNPTHCEPLWGPDPFYAAAFSGDHRDLRGSSNPVHGELLDRTFGLNNSAVSSFREAGDFMPSYIECQRVLYGFRSYFIAQSAADVGLRSALVTLSQAHVNNDRDPIQVVFTTRKGDWARQLTNEDEIVEAIRRHLPRLASLASKNFSPRREATLLVVKFRGNLSEQLFQQLDVTRSTIFVGNHGANLLNSVYLRPNAGVVTLSLRNPGFWPFAVFPSWLHWRDIVIEHVCNRRLFKGKCKWGETHNNDMFATRDQIVTLLKFLEEIVEAQREQQRSEPN